MKLLFICAGLILSGLTFCTVGPKESGNAVPKTKVELTADTPVKQTVIDFWDGVQKADYQKLSELTREVPDDAYRDCLKVNASGKAERADDTVLVANASSDRTNNPFRKDLDSIFRRSLEKWIEKKFSLVEIQDVIVNGDEAIVNIKYSGHGFTFGEDMFLYKENDKWQIFYVFPKSAIVGNDPLAKFTKKQACR